jgi:hypothetical protein
MRRKSKRPQFLLLILLLLLPSVSASSVQQGTPEHHFFRGLEIDKAGHTFFKFQNTASKFSTLTGYPVETVYPKGNEKNWYSKYCFFGFCFTEKAESNTRLKPGGKEEMTASFYPLKGAKVGERAKMVLDIWPTIDPNLKERLWFYGVVVEPKTVLLTVNSQIAQINKKEITLDAKPYLDRTNNRVMVPFRFLGETFGAKVGWFPTEKKITYELGDEVLTFILGLSEVKMQLGPDYSKMLPLEAPSKLVNNRLYVPVRLVSELLGSMITWDGKTQGINIIFPHLPTETSG